MRVLVTYVFSSFGLKNIYTRDGGVSPNNQWKGQQFQQIYENLSLMLTSYDVMKWWNGILLQPNKFKIKALFLQFIQ